MNIPSIAIGLVAKLLHGVGRAATKKLAAPEEKRDQVRSSVSDVARSQAILKSVDEIDGLLVESAVVMNDAASRERVLFLDYDSTRDNYTALFYETRRECN